MSLWYQNSNAVEATIVFEQAQFLQHISSPDGVLLAKLDDPLGDISMAAHAKDGIYAAVIGKPDMGFCTEQGGNASFAEQLVHAYQHGGEHAIADIQGAFALILYDRFKQTTLLYRPFLNGLPLYYINRGGLLTAASNPLDLLHRNDVNSSVNETEVARIFQFASSRWQESVFSEMQALKHGELVLLTQDAEKHSYADLDKLLPELQFKNLSQSLIDYRELLDAAVMHRLDSSSQYGLMLSSGLDSSSLAAVAKKHLHESQLQAISWSLTGDKAGDEIAGITKVCQHLGVPLHIFDGNGFGPFDELEKSWLVPETPYTNPFWLLTDALYKQAKNREVDVLLNGNFADVLVPGPRYIFKDMWRDKRPGELVPMLSALVHQYGWSKTLRSPAIRSLIKRLPHRQVLKLEAWMPADTSCYANIVSAGFKSGLPKQYERFSTALSPFQSGYPGIDRYLSSARGLRRLEPHRDINLLNFSLRLPAYWHYQSAQMKAFIRKSIQADLPAEICQQPRVGNLGGLVARSFERNRNAIRARLLDQPCCWSNYVDKSWMESCLSNHAAINYRDALLVWQSLNLQSWTAAIQPGGRLFRKMK